MKRIIISICSIFFLVQASFAVDLMTVYKQALDNDPTFKQALATYQSTAEAMPQAVAVLLPQLSANGTGELDKNYISPTTRGGSTRTLGFDLLLNQSVLNFQNWANLYAAKYSVKSAFATYNAAAQALMIRTATAYFNVLKAQEILRYAIANKTSYYQQYLQAKTKYEVGIADITDVYNAKAYYEGAISIYVTDKNNVDIQKENLRAITGTYYSTFSILEASLPLIIPEPENIDQWVGIANLQNWTLVASRYNVLNYRGQLLSAKAGHLPTLALASDYGNSNTNGSAATSTTAGRTKDLDTTLTLAVPVFTGGTITSKVRQALAQYELADQQREQQARTTVDSTRTAYLNVVSGIQNVQADVQSIKAYQSTLEGMQEGYKVGTQTMVDVLTAQTNLYNQLQTYATDRYLYVINLLTLKQQAGTLTADDLVAMNQWLRNAPPTDAKTAENIDIKTLVPENMEMTTTSSAAKKPTKVVSAKSPSGKKMTPAKSGVAKKAIPAKNLQKKPTTNIEKSTGIYLQIGAFKQQVNAEKMKTKAEQITKQPVFIEKNGLYKVKVGPLKSQDVATEVSREILQKMK